MPGTVLPPRALPALLLLALLAGCSSGDRFAPVKGKVVVKGAPGVKLRLEFHPDIGKGTKGPSSTGETDEQGEFTLAYATSDRTGEGAIVGWHKVVVQDLRLAESETGRGVPIRFSPDYGTILTTPLIAEVKAGDPNVVVEIPPK